MYDYIQQPHKTSSLFTEMSGSSDETSVMYPLQRGGGGVSENHTISMYILLAMYKVWPPTDFDLIHCYLLGRLKPQPWWESSAKEVGPRLRVCPPHLVYPVHFL